MIGWLREKVVGNGFFGEWEEDLGLLNLADTPDEVIGLVEQK